MSPSPSRVRVYPHVSLSGKRVGAGRDGLVFGLHALNSVPVKTTLIYPGLMLDRFEMQHFREHFKLEISQAYAASGPKQHGLDVGIFGDISAKPGVNNPFACAHRINALVPGQQSGARYNCILDKVTATHEHLERHPELAAQLVVGTPYPAMIVTRDIAPGEELIARTYGTGYWALMRQEREQRAAHRVRFLIARCFSREHRAFIEALRNSRQRRVRGLLPKK